MHSKRPSRSARNRGGAKGACSYCGRVHGKKAPSCRGHVVRR